MIDVVMCSLNDAARTALEALMRSGTYEYQSEFARHYVAQGRKEGVPPKKAAGAPSGRGTPAAHHTGPSEEEVDGPWRGVPGA
jgi:hypothetical protein